MSLSVLGSGGGVMTGLSHVTNKMGVLYALYRFMGAVDVKHHTIIKIDWLREA